MNEVPRPGRLRTVIVPPCASVSWRAIARPSPLPPVARLRDSSARQNRSKIFETAGGQPGQAVERDRATLERRAERRAAFPGTSTFKFALRMPTSVIGPC